MTMNVRLLALFLLLTGPVHAQQFVFPDAPSWTNMEEGKPLSFRLATTDSTAPRRFALEGGATTGMSMDSLGNFSWIPSYDLVSRLEKQKEFGVLFQAEWKDGRQLRQSVNFILHHVNRPPIVEDMPTFYVKQGTLSRYQIPTEYVRDPDGDLVVIKPRESQMPEGASMSATGLLTWTPSRNQFNALRTSPLYVEFIAQDQPDKAETIGKIRVAQTQLDLPPDLLLVPSDSVWNVKETDVVYFKVYASDPNGDDNIDQVDFISSDMRLPKSALKENSRVQREFTWTPGYDFVDEAEKKRDVVLTFFAFDKSNNRVQRRVRVTINDTENVEEKDKLLYQKYFNTLAASKNLIDMLDENNEKLEHIYKKARKGKKSRTIVTASLGGISGLSPLILDTNPSKTVTMVGGTSVLVINSLEAGQVIGRSANDYQNKIKSNRDLRTQLQLKGNYFARKYALKSQRRNLDFETDRDDLVRLLNTDITSLEMPAVVQSIPKGKEIKKTFSDFTED
ncbi:MAG: Ig domain-containing protein [Cyclobacteriaceae bacterium]|jgi:hypothetical protein